MSFKFTKSNLNFDVYTVASKPTTPGANNDIAIITSVPMPNWIMSPDKPSGTPRSEGDVWIQYSVSGKTFNALKNNSMMIATIFAWQYADGAWIEVEAVSCQNGEWVEWWDGYYYKSGEGSKVGDWKASYQPGNTSNAITFEEEAIKFDWKSGIYSVMVAFSPIQDLTNVSKLKFRVKGANHNFAVGATTTQYGGSEDSTFAAKTIQEGLSGEKELIVDVSSLTGKYYIAISGHPASTPSVGYCYDVQEVD